MPVPGAAAWNEYAGGPATLLQWLETQLGLQADRPTPAERVFRFALRLAETKGATVARSFAVDPWATSAALLARRDELRLHGWDGRDDPRFPPVVRDLAATEASAGAPLDGEPDRLDAVLGALDAGQRLPPHEILLLEPVSAWPDLWQRVLARLSTGVPPSPGASASGRLGSLQSALLGTGAAVEPGEDPTFAWWSAGSALAACQALAAALAANPSAMARTVVCCENEATAELLDASLERIGAPTMGAARANAAAAPLEALPLALALLWEPVDPWQLLAYLNLPVKPVRSRAARALSDALSKQPGLGSAKWEEAWAALTAPGADPGGDVRENLEEWLVHARVRRGEPLPPALVEERCRRVAKWAAGRASFLEEDAPLRAGLLAAARQAALLGEFVATSGRPVPEAQLARLLRATRPSRPVPPVHAARAGGPGWVQSLAEIPAGYGHLVWIGPIAGGGPGGKWSPAERGALAACGIHVPATSRDVGSQRASERAGIARIRESLLVVSLPQDAAAAPHPVWVHARTVLDAAESGLPPTRVERAIEDGGLVAGPWVLARATHRAEAPHGPRPVWRVSPDLLVPLDHASPTETESRLACPLQWVFRRQAGVRPGRHVSIPEGAHLVGLFAHDLFAAVFGRGGPPPAEEEAERLVVEAFDRRVALDAAPLALPAQALLRARARHALATAAREFVRALHRGSYRVLAVEAPLRATVGGVPMVGSADVLLVAADGSEAIVDLKYPGGAHHEEMLAEGRSLQLAAYVHLREAGGARVHGVAYLMLGGRGLRTPGGSPLRGADGAALLRDAPDVRETWSRLEAALRAADSWRLDGAIPARPLLPAGQWPPGVALALDADPKRDSPQPPCRYCDYGKLCGLAEVR